MAVFAGTPLFFMLQVVVYCLEYFIHQDSIGCVY